MGWDIRKNDVHDDAVMHRAYEITRAAVHHERADTPMWTELENTSEYREPDPAELVESYGAYDDDEMVGCGLSALLLNDNTDKAFIVPWVEPERRRQGIGSALLEHMGERAADAGRSVILSQSVYPFERRDDHPYLRFAEKHGYSVSLTQIRRELALPVPEDRLEGWIDEARPHHDGYRIEFHAGLLPDELLPSFCHAMNQLIVDAPQGNVSFEPESITPEQLRQRHENNAKAGRTTFHAVAIDGASGDVVAYSTISVSVGQAHDMYQWGTLVRADHRGHRLGLAVKARCLLEVQRLHPERTRISTTNAEDNAQMVAINVQMGYRAIEVEPEFVRKLT
jgi:GNAT superfamily N-acetyltransferase/L-amino acid N-acyltransferase YncA